MILLKLYAKSCVCSVYVYFSGEECSMLCLPKFKNHKEEESWSYAQMHLNVNSKMANAVSVQLLCSIGVSTLEFPSFGPDHTFGAIFSGKRHRFRVFQPPIALGLYLLETNPGIFDSGSLSLVHESEAPGDLKRFLG